MSSAESPTPRARKRIWLWIAATLFALIGTALIALPYVIQHFAVQWLEQNGADHAQIEDVDLNLFAGTFQLDHLVVQQGQAKPLVIGQLAGDINWLDLLDKRAVVQALWLYGGHLSVVQDARGGLTIGGITLPKADATPAPPAPPAAAPAASSDWAFGVNALVLADTRVEYRAPQLTQDLQFTVLYLLNMHSWEPGLPAQVGLDMRINDQPFRISSDVRAFADDPTSVAQLELDALKLSDFAALAGLADVQNLSGTLSLKIAVDAVQKNKTQTHFDVNGDITLKDLRATYGDMRIDQGLLHCTGAAHVRLKEAADVPMVEVQGQWQSRDSAFALGDLSLEHAGLNWRTATKLYAAQGDNARPRIHTQGEGQIDGLRVDDSKRKLRLAAVDRVAIRDADVQMPDPPGGKGVSVASVEVSGLSALQPDAVAQPSNPAVVTVGKTTLQAIGYRFDPARVEIDSIRVNGLKGHFVREKDGALYGLAQLAAGDAAGAPKTAAEPEAASADAEVATQAPQPAPLTLRLGSLKIDDNAQIHWTDKAVTPTAKVTVTPLSLSVGAFDTAVPTAHTPIELLASLHKNNAISFKGQISPLDPKPNSQLDGSIKRLDLTGFAPYAAAAGYTLRSGRLDAQITAKTKAGELDMLNKLVLTKLRLEGGGGGAKRDAAGGASAMPLNVALGYLRDSEDRIKLDIPVTGNVRDPKFSFNDVFRLAMQAAAQQAAMSYVTAALQPLGTVLFVGKLVNQAANAMQLQAIEFAPGETALDDKARAYTQKLAGLLTSRPGVKLSVCGNGTEADRAALLAKLQQTQLAQKDTPRNEPAKDAAPASTEAALQVNDDQLLQLADQRSKAVRDLLVDQHKVNPDQLFDCRPVLDADAAALPSVTLGL